MSDRSDTRAIKDFLAEAEEILENLNLDLVALGDGAERGEADPELINRIFRGAHSLKGISGMFGFEDISALAHEAEELLDGLRLGRLELDRQLTEVLFEVLEVLLRLVQGKGSDESFTLDLDPVLSRIGRLAAGKQPVSDPLVSANLDPSILSVLTEYEEHRLRDNLQRGRRLLRIRAIFDLATFDQGLAELTDTLKAAGEVISTLPGASDQPDKIAFQLLFGTSRDLPDIQAEVGDEQISVDLLAGGPAAKKGYVGPQADVDPEKVLTSGEEAHPPDREVQGGGEASLRSVSRTVRVDIDKLDDLMNIVGELVLSKGAIAGICDSLKVAGRDGLANELAKATRVLERRLEELQKGVMEVRMVPVAQLFEKMVRIVRRLASELGREVSLDLQGTDTELDKLIVEDLSDPLVHLIRNAIDHGIEPPEERVALDKPAKGTLTLRAAQKGNHVVIEVADDGRGIDLDKVKAKGVRLGMLAEGGETSREAVLDLLFAPGFSTREEVTDVSGRGVGLDVVKSNISALSGMIELDSQAGRGTSFSITLPITLAIIKALIVQVRGKTYAVPINSVLETLMIEPAAIRTIERREVMELRESTLPLLRLTDVFGLPGENTRGRAFVAVVGLADKKMGIVVDQLLGQQDVVIKSLGQTLSFVRGVAGAADLGNQKTVLVLDVGGLMGEALRGDGSFYV